MAGNLECWLAEEAAIVQKSDNEKQVYLYEWLQRLEEILQSGNLQRSELKANKGKITIVLQKLINTNCSSAARQQLSKCFATLFAVGDSSGLFETINWCCDVIKSRDDSVSYLPLKLTAISCLGEIYGSIGRLGQTLFPDVQQVLLKVLKATEAQLKCEVLLCIEKLLTGLGNAASASYKDFYRATKVCLSEKAASVRCAAAKCALELSLHGEFLYTNELESMASSCLRALDGSNYDVRVCCAELLGSLMARSQKQDIDYRKYKKINLDDAFGMMSSAFLRGTVGFLKASTGSGISQEIRVGVTQAYVVLFRELGTVWIEKNLSRTIGHVLELVANSRATTSHVDAVYSRKCVSFILNSVLSEMLPESVQINAVKELARIVSRQMNVVHEIVTNSSSSSVASNPDVSSTQHVLVCALNELGNLICELGSSIEPIVQGILNAVFSALIHPAPAACLSAAWCLRCCTNALPSYSSKLLHECIVKMTSMRSSPTATIGYGHTLAAVIGGLYLCPLGIPFKLSKSLFALAEEMLLSPGANFKITTSKVQTGWAILGALMTLGPSFTKHCLPKMLHLWSSAFPATVKDLQAEGNKGTAISWELTLHSRAGALCSIASFIKCCGSLITKDVTTKLMLPVERALATIPVLPVIFKVHGSHLKPHAAMLKLRLYHTLSLLSPRALEGSFSPLLRELVAEFTLADHRGGTTTSLLQSMCHKDDSVLLGSWVQETDHKKVEEQLQANSASGSGALEHDHSCVYARQQNGEDIPGPLPLGVAVIDTSIIVFGQIFPYTAHKHRGQLMEHFMECINKNKGSRQQAIQMNIFTAFLAALKNLAEKKIALGEKGVRDAATNLVLEALGNPDPILRCAAGEALGRMAQVVQDPNFVAQMAQLSFEKAKTARDIASRTGHSLALGCLHRYVGGMGSGQHVNSSISILMALARDESSPTVQMWALHALTLIADSGGPMFRSHVESSIFLTLNLLLKTPPSLTEIHQCLGKCIGALITTVGPELQDSTKIMKTLQTFCMTACSVMQNHPDSLVQAESITCLQQLHMFAPNFVNLALLVPQLCAALLSNHLLLRRASVACMRQLSHREAKEVCDHSLMTIQNWTAIKHRMFVGELGLEGILFTLFDREVDPRLRADIRETLVSLLQTLASENLSHWLSLCKQVLLASKTEAKAEDDRNTSSDDSKKDDKNDDNDDDNEEEEIVMAKPKETQSVTPKWPTRVFAMECIRMIIQACAQERAHLDLAMARELKRSDEKSDFLVMHLSELVRMAFIAGTSNNDQLRLEGMKALQDVVSLFARVEDPDIQGHVILEQFQAQVGTALRPAFKPSTPPDITAMACEVCSAWIGSEISQDINDVRRIQQLLTTSLSKFSSGEEQEGRLYSESAYTLETLAVLKAWAQIYIMAIKHERDDSISGNAQETSDDDASASGGSLLELVEKDLRLLLKHWIDVLRDYAYLMLPVQYAPQLPSEGGNFYRPETIDDVRSHYRQTWPPILHAVALWLDKVGFINADLSVLGASDESPNYSKKDADSMLSSPKTPTDINKDRYHLLSGLCMEALCAPLHSYAEETIDTCTHAMTVLHQSEFGRRSLNSDKALSIELLTVLYRLVLTKDDGGSVKEILCLVELVSRAAVEYINSDSDGALNSWTAEEDIIQGKSIVFSLMEICLFVISQYALEMIPAASVKTLLMSSKQSVTLTVIFQVLHIASCILADVPSICSPSASIETLPSLMYLLTGIFKFFIKYSPKVSEEKDNDVAVTNKAFQKTLQSLKVFVNSRYTKLDVTEKSWNSIIQSTIVSLMNFAMDEEKDSETYSGIINKDLDLEKLLLTMSVFLLDCNVDVLSPPSILDGYLQLFYNCYIISACQTKVKVVQILAVVIKSKDPVISYPFIHKCVPIIVKDLENAQISKPKTQVEFDLLKEGITLLELLIEATEESKRVHMMSIFIRCLLDLLLPTANAKKSGKFAGLLHEHSLQRLTKIGPMYPEPFKAAMVKTPALKTKLEGALRASQTIKQGQTSIRQESSQPAQPKIQLKMDFSNFK